MSEENVEIARRALDAFAAVDVERLLEFMDPEIEFEPRLGGKWRASWKGVLSRAPWAMGRPALTAAARPARARRK